MTALEDWLNLTNPGAAVIAAATGGTVAPSDTAPAGQNPEASRAQPAPIDVRGALLALQQGFQAFARRHGGGVGAAAPRPQVTSDAASGGTGMGQAPQLVTRGAAPEGTDPLTALLGRVANVTTHGPRSGQASQEYDLGGGQFAHVYYDSKGRRKVFKFHR